MMWRRPIYSFIKLDESALFKIQELLMIQDKQFDIGNGKMITFKTKKNLMITRLKKIDYDNFVCILLAVNYLNIPELFEHHDKYLC